MVYCHLDRPGLHLQARLLRQVLGEPVQVEGREGTLGPPAEFLHRLIYLTVATLIRETVSLKWLQILAGRWVRMMQFR